VSDEGSETEEVDFVADKGSSLPCFPFSAAVNESLGDESFPGDASTLAAVDLPSSVFAFIGKPRNTGGAVVDPGTAVAAPKVNGLGAGVAPNVGAFPNSELDLGTSVVETGGTAVAGDVVAVSLIEALVASSVVGGSGTNWMFAKMEVVEDLEGAVETVCTLVALDVDEADGTKAFSTVVRFDISLVAGRSGTRLILAKMDPTVGLSDAADAAGKVGATVVFSLGAGEPVIDFAAVVGFRTLPVGFVKGACE